MSKQNKVPTHTIKGTKITLVEDPDVNRMVASYLLRQKFKSNNLVN